MKRTFCRLICLILTLLWIMGCDTALTVGSKTMGFRSGEFIYTDGYLRATYTVPFDPMWTVCERTLTEMNAVDVEPARKIATGTFTAMIQRQRLLRDPNERFLYTADFTPDGPLFQHGEFVERQGGSYSWNRIGYAMSPDVLAWFREWPESA